MSNEPTVNLIRALIENMGDGLGGAPENWESLAMVIESFDGKFNSAHGYAYSPDNTITAVASDPFATMPVVEEYLKSHYKAGEPLPVKFLVQFNRANGKYKVTFEDTDEDRWKVSPATIKTIREELRPQLG